MRSIDATSLLFFAVDLGGERRGAIYLAITAKLDAVSAVRFGIAIVSVVRQLVGTQL